MKLAIVVAIMVAMSSSLPFEEDAWTAFKTHYGKFYSPNEDQYRRSIFLERQKVLEEHNANYAARLVSYGLTPNEVADLVPEDWRSHFNVLDQNSQLINHELHRKTYRPPANIKLPDYVDWRKQGAVTPVKEQGPCDSSWAISVVGSLEGQLFRKTGKLVSLSAQQLIHCSWTSGNYGCHGGYLDRAFKYIQDFGGLVSEEAYPYVARDGSCHIKREEIVKGTAVMSVMDLPQGNETALQAAVATVGPVPVVVSTANLDFMSYHSGILSGNSCNSSEFTQVFLVVGYGTENGNDYWTLKSSWGTGWGEEGYIRLARNKGNVCGIASSASYPVL